MARESAGARTDRAARIRGILAREYPDADCALHYGTPFQLLVATILSAQCTDEKVNEVTAALFRDYGTPEALAKAPPEEIERIVHPTGFFRQKTKSILATASDITERHGGEVPRTMEGLVALRGVARKTANVVLGVAYGKAVGVVVDTHVKRITNLLGLTKQKDPVKIEREWMALIPQKDWIDISHLLIRHGRGVCVARRPACDHCVLRDRCPSSHA